MASASKSKTPPFSILGFRVKGDLGPWTLYTDRYGRKQWYYFTPPKKPPTPKQTLRRQRFRTAQQSWQQLNPDQKKSLEDLVHAASAPLTGQNIYISAALTHTQSHLRALAARYRIVCPIPPHIP